MLACVFAVRLIWEYTIDTGENAHSNTFFSVNRKFVNLHPKIKN